MKDEPMISITRVLDSEVDYQHVGELDYIIHCQPLEQWLSGGTHRGVSVEQRRAALVAEMRDLADKLERGDHPFVSTLEWAERRAVEVRARIAEHQRAEFKVVP